MRIYWGHVGWGWNMYGIGYKSVWFLGFSTHYTQAQYYNDYGKMK